MTKLFDDYYDNHEPKSIYDNIRDLRRRLNRKKVLNVNVIEDEHAKIKKENMGKGALIDSSLRVDDSSMRMFSQELQSMLQLPNKEDKFMQYKLKIAKDRSYLAFIEAQKKQLATPIGEIVKPLEFNKNQKDQQQSDSEDASPSIVNKKAEEEVEKLQMLLESLLQTSPNVKQGHIDRTKFLKATSVSNFESIPIDESQELNGKMPSLK